MTAPDDDYLTSWAREQQAASFTRDRNHDDRCSSCGHVWHGLQCQAQGPALPCSCATAFRESA